MLFVKGSVARMKRAINEVKAILNKKKILKLQAPLSFEMESHRRSKEQLCLFTAALGASSHTWQSPEVVQHDLKLT